MYKQVGAVVFVKVIVAVCVTVAVCVIVAVSVIVPDSVAVSVILKVGVIVADNTAVGTTVSTTVVGFVLQPEDITKSKTTTKTKIFFFILFPLYFFPLLLIYLYISFLSSYHIKTKKSPASKRRTFNSI